MYFKIIFTIKKLESIEGCIFSECLVLARKAVIITTGCNPVVTSTIIKMENLKFEYGMGGMEIESFYHFDYSLQKDQKKKRKATII